MSDNVAKMKELWQNYMFITTELGKFTSPEDVDLFADLLCQREKLMVTIKKTPDEDNYIKSDEGQQFIKQIVKLDKVVYGKMSIAKNVLKQKFELSSAYDGYSPIAGSVGVVFDSNNN